MLAAHLSLSRPGFEFSIDAELVTDGVTAVVGRSGAGKTTLLRCVAGLEREAKGVVRFGETCWQDDAKGVFVPAHKRRVGYVFQEGHLFSHLTVGANLDYAQRRALDSDDELAREDIVELLGLDEMLGRRPHELSLGEQQRVGIARALLSGPRLMILDEPLAALDVPSKQEVVDLLRSLRYRSRVPMIYVSHSVSEVLQLADRLLLLDRGCVAAEGPLPELVSGVELVPLLGDAAGAVLEAIVEAHDLGYGLSRVRCHGHTLFLPLQRAAPGERIRVHIHARDVSLSVPRPLAPLSVLNVIPARVVAINYNTGDGYTVAVKLDIGCPLVAQITRKSLSAMRLIPGQALYACVKAASLRQELATLEA